MKDEDDDRKKAYWRKVFYRKGHETMMYEQCLKHEKNDEGNARLNRSQGCLIAKRDRYEKKVIMTMKISINF